MRRSHVNIIIVRHKKWEIRVNMITFITKQIKHNVMKSIALAISLCAFFPHQVASCHAVPG